jgi:hypothetical protein
MRTRLRHTLISLAVALVLALVSLAYLQPQMAVTLANQIWNCF